jgi:hypothetical protein
MPEIDVVAEDALDGLGLKGMMAMDVSARASAISGARKYVNLSTPAGVVISFSKNFSAIGQRLQQPVWPDAVRPPARLHVRHDLALKPRVRYAFTVSTMKSNSAILTSVDDEIQRATRHKVGKEVDHGWMSASLAKSPSWVQ